MREKYATPRISTEKSFDTSALACGKIPDPPPGSYHWESAYDTFVGHFGPRMGASQSVSGSRGVGFGPGATSQSYSYSGLCLNWITYSS